jgi:hypothetical protein
MKKRKQKKNIEREKIKMKIKKKESLYKNIISVYFQGRISTM